MDCDHHWHATRECRALTIPCPVVFCCRCGSWHWMKLDDMKAPNAPVPGQPPTPCPLGSWYEYPTGGIYERGSDEERARISEDDARAADWISSHPSEEWPSAKYFRAFGHR